MAGKKILLVEGNADKLFFTALLRKTGLKGVDVSPPIDLSAEGNGRGNALSLLPSLLQQCEDGRISALGVVVDADYKINNLGAHQAFAKVSDIVKAKGYTAPSPWPKSETKYVFKHSDGLPEIGLWIMPDCNAEGMVENAIHASVSQNQSNLMSSAVTAVNRIHAPLFDKNIHLHRAYVYTWLAWQAIPGKELSSAVNDNLVDVTKPPLAGCCSWLKEVFS